MQIIFHKTHQLYIWRQQGLTPTDCADKTPEFNSLFSEKEKVYNFN